MGAALLLSPAVARGQPAVGGTAPGASSTGSYRATVLERGSRRPVFGATVSIVDAVGITDERGLVQLDAVLAGTQTLVVVAGGYERLEETVTIAPNERLEDVLRLQPEGDNPYETVVRAERPREEVARRSLGRPELRKIPGTFGDPLRAVLNLPGIARAPFSLGLLLVRGTGPDDSAVFVDGHEVPNLYHFLGGPAILNAEMLERIDYYPGNFGARYGRAIGGAIDVTTRAGDAQGLHGDVEIDLIDTSLFVEGPLFGFTVSAAARRSYVDAVLPFFLPEPEQGTSLAVVPVYYDFQLRVDRRLGGRSRAWITLLGSDDRLELVSSDPKAGEALDLDAHIGFWRLQGGFRADLARGLTSTFSPSVGHDLLTFDAGTGTSADIGLMAYRLREELAWKARRGVELRVGVDLEHIDEDVSAVAPIPPEYRTLNTPCARAGGGEGDGNGRVNDEGDLSGQSKLVRSMQLTSLAAYAELVWDVPGGLKLIPSLRVERYSYGEVTPIVVDPRLTLRYALDERTTLKSALGLYQQQAPVQFIDEQFGNPRLGPERSEQYTVGFERKLTDAINLDLQLFYSARHDLAVLSDEVTATDVLERELFDNDGRGRSYGLELLVRHEVTRRLFGWVSYTLSRSEVQASAHDDASPYFFDQMHNLIVVASYKLDGGWELGARYRLTTGRPETPVLGATLDADSGRYCAYTGQPRSTRGALFSQLDLRIEKTWTFDLWRFSVYLDVQNVMNRQNPEGTLYDYRFRESTALPGLPILPTIGIRGTL